jgi:SPP1 family predicted phage head-tail adaptor
MASGFWTKINPGTLRHKVSFYRPGTTLDYFGKVAPGLELVVEDIHADFYPVRGNEYYEIRKIQGKVTHKCYCRHHSKLVDADSTWYLKYKDKLYSIESIVDAGNAKRMYEIYCTEHIDKELMPYGIAAYSSGDGGTDTGDGDNSGEVS